MMIKYAISRKGNPCTVFTFDGWYVVNGSKNINFCADMIDVKKDDFTYNNPLYVAALADTDKMMASQPVLNLYHLLTLVCGQGKREGKTK